MKTTAVSTDPITEEMFALKAKLAEIEAKRAAELGSLPERYKFDSLESFIAAVRANYKPSKGEKPKGKPGRPKKADKAVKAPEPKKKGKRAKITDEIKALVIELTKAGELTIAQIAKKAGISGPAVSEIRKKAKLVKKGVGRKAKSAPAPASPETVVEGPERTV